MKGHPMKDLEIQTSSIEAILSLSDDEVMFMIDQLIEFIEEVTEGCEE
jgi:hypothetical protein